MLICVQNWQVIISGSWVEGFVWAPPKLAGNNRLLAHPTQALANEAKLANNPKIAILFYRARIEATKNVK